MATQAGSLEQERQQEYRQRVIVVMTIVAAAFLLLFIRLFYLQIALNAHYTKLAKNNQEQLIPIPAFRGEIFDATGVRIAYNQNTFGLYLVPYYLPTNYFEREELLHRTARVFDIDLDSIKQKIKKTRYSKFDIIDIAEDVPATRLVYLAEHNEEFPGIYFKSRQLRFYSYTNTLAHVVGYVGKISPREFETKREEGYRLDAILGKDGVEQSYDRELRGRDGYKKRIVDARNRIKEELTPVDGQPVPGKKLVLSIDYRIQRIAEKLMEGFSGVVIASRPTTGEIVALVSSPWYDPNMFLGKVDRDTYDRMLNDPLHPFWNKAIAARYPASSTFKVVVSLAALEEEKADLFKNTYCSGGMMLENKFFKCEGEHGFQNLLVAIQNSCNTYFYNLGYEIGPNIIKKYSLMFGYGEKSGIDLFNETVGMVPSPDWKREQKGEYWWDGDTLQYAIGQGYMLVTPIAVHNMMCAVVNDGVAYRPHVVKELRSSETGDIVVNNDRKILRTVQMKEEHFHTIKRALRMVVTGGTARYGAYSPRIAIAGKTGTAQNIHGEDHSWFVCYAPYTMKPTDETLVVTVLIEHGGGGGLAAAPIATALIRGAFEGEDAAGIKSAIMERWRSERERRRALYKTETILGE
ncbi:MAG: penicillin-binding protein 2 [Spirochaetes bacterium]|nr:penicillin-binding protein 2 [Spirochaetota bacterium]